MVHNWVSYMTYFLGRRLWLSLGGYTQNQSGLQPLKNLSKTEIAKYPGGIEHALSTHLSDLLTTVHVTAPPCIVS